MNKEETMNEMVSMVADERVRMSRGIIRIEVSGYSRGALAELKELRGRLTDAYMALKKTGANPAKMLNTRIDGKLAAFRYERISSSTQVPAACYSEVRPA